VLEHIVGKLPPLQTCIVIVQHIPAHFTVSLRKNLAEDSSMAVRVAEHGDRVQPGCILIAPSGYHLVLDQKRSILLEAGEKVNYVCPSIDVTMQSIARDLFDPVVGILLTGMGRDGAAGIKHIRAIGGRTIAQDPETCAIASMPETAIKEGGVEQILIPERIREWLVLTFAK
jgi:two-component system chemotaxis response regulator CheB